MKTRIFLIITFLSFFTIGFTYAQGKIVFLNGKERRFSTAELKGEYIVFKPEDSTRPRRADRYNVFSINRDNGTEEMIYNPDTMVNDDPTIAEVRDYIRGEQFAMEVYRKPLNFIGGVATGLAGSALTIYGLPVPIVYATIVGRFNPKLPKGEETKNHSESFVAGYHKKSRNMKIKKSLIGGGIGFAVGITALVVIFSNE